MVLRSNKNRGEITMRRTKLKWSNCPPASNPPTYLAFRTDYSSITVKIPHTVLCCLLLLIRDWLASSRWWRWSDHCCPTHSIIIRIRSCRISNSQLKGSDQPAAPVVDERTNEWMSDWGQDKELCNFVVSRSGANLHTIRWAEEREGEGEGKEKGNQQKHQQLQVYQEIYPCSSSPNALPPSQEKDFLGWRELLLLVRCCFCFCLVLLVVCPRRSARTNSNNTISPWWKWMYVDSWYCCSLSTTTRLSSESTLERIRTGVQCTSGGGCCREVGGGYE